MGQRGLSTAFLLAVVLTFAPGASKAGEVRVAVASNFAPAMRELAARFEERTGHHVILSAGSTGKQYAQIRNGAPFDVFFAADAERPRRLEQEGVALPGSRFIYAQGRLILWSPTPGLVDRDGHVLETNAFHFLAIANPRLAPYGRAAREFLEARGLWERLSRRIARGENVAQAFQFVRAGQADLGFVARSQVMSPGRPVSGSYWDVPPGLHAPIIQQAVLLRDSVAARQFLAFATSVEAIQIIREHGYDTP